jgi:hypothetical protein
VGTLHRLDTGHASMPLSEAVAAFLTTLDHPESAGTRKVYGSTLRALLAEFGAALDLRSCPGPPAASASPTGSPGPGASGHPPRGTETGTRSPPQGTIGTNRAG